MKTIILITSLFITSFSFAQSKTDIISKGTKVGFKIHADCALAEKYTLEACIHIPEQRIFCHNIGEKTISEQTNCSGNDIKISLLTPSEEIRKKEGQGTYQKKVKFMDRFRIQQQQQQQESGRN